MRLSNSEILNHSSINRSKNIFNLDKSLIKFQLGSNLDVEGPFRRIIGRREDLLVRAAII